VTPFIIAIDGPSGSGKGTLARRLAEALGYRHVDTGAMYRAVAWRAHELGHALDDEEAIAKLAETSAIVQEDGRFSIDGHDVTRAIRTPEIDRAAASVARLPKVRQILVSRQRDLGSVGGIVMEGRDIGTVVFPAADIKLYLDASPDERARRRANDPAHSSGPAQVAEVATLMTERDRSDQTRTASPLYAADDAVVIDTTGKSIEQVVKKVLAIVRSKCEV